MEPRVFISSTFCDLKYVREEIGNFVSQYGFHPLRFENGDIGYEHGKELDESCYEEMKCSDLSILIIGGRYGSPTSVDIDKKNDFDDFISVTRQEFITATRSNIPIFAFVEENVLTEYQLYRNNKKKFEDNPSLLQFNSVDNINVFRFVDNIYSLSKYAITPFKTMDDIKAYLKKQWADMFWKYLRGSRDTTEISEIYSSIQSMQSIIQKIGEKVIENKKDYENVVNEQKIEKVASQIANTYSFVSSMVEESAIEEYIRFFVDRLIIVFDKGYIDYYFSSNINDVELFHNYFKHNDVVLIEVKNRLKYDNEMFDFLRKNVDGVVKRLKNADYTKKMGLNSKNY